MTASTAVTTTTTLPVREAASVPTSFSQSSLVDFRDIVFEHRDILDHPRGRASTSLEIDRRAGEQYKPRTFSHSGGPQDDATPAKSNSIEAKVPSTVSLRQVEAGSNGSAFRPKPPQHRFTTGAEKTEKIWSIGSGEGAEEDGLVEKSITEAMTGVEPSTRSRKSSYSLRFFKEGLPPEDKPRRKDTKAAIREKLTPTVEEEELLSKAPKDLPAGTSPTSIRLHRTDRISPKSQLTVPHKLDDLATLTTSPIEDYFAIPLDISRTAKTPLQQQIPETKPKVGHEEVKPILTTLTTSERVGPAPVPEAESETVTVEGRRKSGDSTTTEVGDTQDDGEADESGEEKISSAVFLPHQELQDSRAGDIQDQTLCRLPRTRSQSVSKIHPWLVKADEPEPECQEEEKDEPAYTLSRYPSRESLASKRDELITEKHDDFAIDDESEVNSLTYKPPLAVTPYEDHVHEHQHSPQEPLEAIELIPYKHQVGGHTTIWRFSRRAVCKQLNNRENEFYETIERYHRDLLPFLPRYVASRFEAFFSVPPSSTP